MSIDPSPKADVALTGARPASTPATGAAPPTAAAPPAPRPPGQAPITFWQSFFLGMTRPGELPVYHHSNLFYWWPIWLLGFLFAAATYFSDTHMAIVPAGTEPASKRQVEVAPDKFEKRDVLILPDKADLVTVKNAQGDQEIHRATVYMIRHRGMGTLFVIMLLIVIVITNITLRGLWSVLVMVLLLATAVILYVADWWDLILARLGQLGIFINLGGYFALALVLFILWCVNFFIMDRQTYMIFTPGQLRVRLEVGGGETVYDTAGMVFFKQRSDLFRHWVLGFGSGDLIVRPAGLGHALELPNVLNVGKKVKQIEELVKEKVVVTGPM